MQSQSSIVKQQLEKLYFVLRTGYNSKDDASKDMKRAYTSARDHIEKLTEWITEADCTKLDEEKLTKMHVFVFEKFSGTAFERMRKAPSTVIGPRCLISSFMGMETIPLGVHPVYTTAMRNLIVCSTGLKATEKASVSQLVFYMGGYYLDVLNATCTHVVSSTVKSVKYEKAAEIKLPIMHPDWVQRVWEESLQHYVHAADECFLERHRLPVFHGLTITSTGLTAAKKNEVKSLIEANGGVYAGAFRSDVTDILILEKGSIETAEFQGAVRLKKECLTPEWIVDSAACGYALPIREYEVKSLKASTPTKSNDGGTGTPADVPISGGRVSGGAFNPDCTQLSEISHANFSARRLSALTGESLPTASTGRRSPLDRANVSAETRSRSELDEQDAHDRSASRERRNDESSALPGGQPEDDDIVKQLKAAIEAAKKEKKSIPLPVEQSSLSPTEPMETCDWDIDVGINGVIWRDRDIENVQMNKTPQAVTGAMDSPTTPRNRRLSALTGESLPSASMGRRSPLDRANVSAETRSRSELDEQDAHDRSASRERRNDESSALPCGQPEDDDIVKQLKAAIEAATKEKTSISLPVEGKGTPPTEPMQMYDWDIDVGVCGVIWRDRDIENVQMNKTPQRIGSSSGKKLHDSPSEVHRGMWYRGTPIFAITGVQEEVRVSLARKIELLEGLLVPDPNRYDPVCTHILCGQPYRSDMILSGIAAGKWILSTKYLDDSYDAGHFLDEESYEWGNPKAAEPLAIQTTPSELETAVYTWRKRIATHVGKQDGAFTGFRVLLVAHYKEPLVRLVQLGGGFVIHCKPPFSNSERAMAATHCFVNPRLKLPTEDHRVLAEAGIPVLSLMYMRDYLTSTSLPDPNNYQLPL